MYKNIRKTFCDPNICDQNINHFNICKSIGKMAKKRQHWCWWRSALNTKLGKTMLKREQQNAQAYQSQRFADNHFYFISLYSLTWALIAKCIHKKHISICLNGHFGNIILDSSFLPPSADGVCSACVRPLFLLYWVACAYIFVSYCFSIQPLDLLLCLSIFLFPFGQLTPSHTQTKRKKNENNLL